MLRVLLCLTLVSLFAFRASAQFEKQIIGDTLPLSGSIHSYSVKANLASFDWAVVPRSAGKIVSVRGDSVKIQWATNSASSARKCSVAVMITYPNADQSLNYFRVVQIQPSETINKKTRTADRGFSRFSASGQTGDSLRFFYRILCDSIAATRRILFSDSSEAAAAASGISWQITGVRSKKTQKASGRQITLRLAPGTYSVTMNQKRGERQLKITDTLTLYPAPVPAFTVSTQTPCNGTSITFSNTAEKLRFAGMSVFHFGNGDTKVDSPPERTADYLYNDDVSLMQIYMTKLELKDLHGCFWQSREIPVSVQQNKFTRFNIGIDPLEARLTYPGEIITLECKKGHYTSLPNPEIPYTYQWNTGQTTQQIKVKSPGLYSVIARDRLGCTSGVLGPVAVKQAYFPEPKPLLDGSARLTAGQKATFSINPEHDVFYQFKFIFNQQQSFTTEPSASSETLLPYWQQSTPGLLQVIGIVISGKEGAYTSRYSDTLEVRITE